MGHRGRTPVRHNWRRNLGRETSGRDDRIHCTRSFDYCDDVRAGWTLDWRVHRIQRILGGSDASVWENYDGETQRHQFA